MIVVSLPAGIVEINPLQDALTAQRFFHPDEFDHGYSNTDVRK